MVSVIRSRGAPVNRFIQAVPHGHAGVYLTVSSAAMAIFLKLFRPGPLPAPDDRDVKTFSSAAAACSRAHLRYGAQLLSSFMGEGSPLNIGRPRPSARHLAFPHSRLEVRDL